MKCSLFHYKARVYGCRMSEYKVILQAKALFYGTIQFLLLTSQDTEKMIMQPKEAETGDQR